MSQKKSAAAIELFVDDAGEHRFRIKGKNGEILMCSEGYKDIRNCKKGLNALADVLWLWEIEKIAIKHV